MGDLRWVKGMFPAWKKRGARMAKNDHGAWAAHQETVGLIQTHPEWSEEDKAAMLASYEKIINEGMKK